MLMINRMIKDIQKKYPGSSVFIEQRWRGFEPCMDEIPEVENTWLLCIRKNPDDGIIEKFERFEDMVNFITRLTNSSYKPEVVVVDNGPDPFTGFEMKDNYRGD